MEKSQRSLMQMCFNKWKRKKKTKLKSIKVPFYEELFCFTERGKWHWFCVKWCVSVGGYKQNTLKHLPSIYSQQLLTIS